MKSRNWLRARLGAVAVLCVGIVVNTATAAPPDNTQPAVTNVSLEGSPPADIATASDTQANNSTSSAAVGYIGKEVPLVGECLAAIAADSVQGATAYGTEAIYALIASTGKTLEGSPPATISTASVLNTTATDVATTGKEVPLVGTELAAIAGYSAQGATITGTS